MNNFHAISSDVVAQATKVLFEVQHARRPTLRDPWALQAPKRKNAAVRTRRRLEREEESGDYSAVMNQICWDSPT
jgi:hypothetical protein